MTLTEIPQIENSYVLDVTDELTAEQRTRLSTVGHDLKAIKKAQPHINQIVLRGGGAADMIADAPPNDWDLFYTYRSADGFSTDCVCDEIRKVLPDAKLELFDASLIDLENCLEKEPYADPIERTCGLLSFHTSYHSMFVIDEAGRAWTNTESWGYFQSSTYEVRMAGFVPWAYYPREGDSQNYYAFYVLESIRGIGTILKRNLSCGPQFRQLLEYLPYFFGQAPQSFHENFAYRSRQKIGGNKHVAVQKLIENLDYPKATETAILSILNQLLD